MSEMSETSRPLAIHNTQSGLLVLSRVAIIAARDINNTLVSKTLRQPLIRSIVMLCGKPWQLRRHHLF